MVDIHELYWKIEEKRKELNQLAASNLSSLCTKDILKASTELDTLLADYLKLLKKADEDQDST